MFCKLGEYGNLEARRTQHGHIVGVLIDSG